MQVTVNKKWILLLLLVLGLLFGAGIIWGYENYKDDFANLIDKEVNNNDNEEEANDDFDIPVYGARSQNFGFGANSEWWFYVFQPKVLEYKTENGINYIIAQYHFADEEQGLEKSEIDRHTVKIIVSREEDYELDDDSMNSVDFNAAVETMVRFRGAFSNTKKEGFEESRISFVELQDLIPVGNYIAVALPEYYPILEDRDQAACGSSDRCSFANVWDSLASLEDFQNFAKGGYVWDESIPLVVYEVSDDVYRWSEEGVAEQDLLLR